MTRSERLVTSRNVCIVLGLLQFPAWWTFLRSCWDGILLLAALIGHQQIQWPGFADSCYPFTAVNLSVLNYSVTRRMLFILKLIFVVPERLRFQYNHVTKGEFTNNTSLKFMYVIFRNSVSRNHCFAWRCLQGLLNFKRFLQVLIRSWGVYVLYVTSCTVHSRMICKLFTPVTKFLCLATWSVANAYKIWVTLCGNP